MLCLQAVRLVRYMSAGSRVVLGPVAPVCDALLGPPLPTRSARRQRSPQTGAAAATSPPDSIPQMRRKSMQTSYCTACASVQPATIITRIFSLSCPSLMGAGQERVRRRKGRPARRGCRSRPAEWPTWAPAGRDSSIGDTFVCGRSVRLPTSHAPRSRTDGLFKGAPLADGNYIHARYRNSALN